MAIRGRKSSFMVSAFGEERSLSYWCARFSVHYSTAYTRLKRGWTPEDAITRPSHLSLRGGIWPVGEGPGLIVSRPLPASEERQTGRVQDML